MAHALVEGNTLNDAEGEDETFNFDKFMQQNGLNQVKDIFIKYDLNTLNNLDMNSPNFVKFMSDTGMMTKQHLIPKILQSILSLQQLRKQQAVRPTARTQLVFMSDKERNVFAKTQKYVQDLLK